MFSCLLNNRCTCPRNHNSSRLRSSVGLTLRPSKEKNTLKKLLHDYFGEKISSISDCSKCRHATTDLGTEQLKIVKFPRYLIIFLDELNDDGTFEKPLKKFAMDIDMTEFKEDVLETQGH